MKVIFLHDVPNVAKAGETKEVADGYGRNYLIPKNLAVLADTNARNVLDRQHKIQAKFEAEQSEVARGLDGTEVVLKAQTGAEGKFFGSITAADIAHELKNVTGIDVDKRKIELAEPIKQLGNYEITVRLAKEAVAKIKATIIEQEAPATEKEATQGEQRETTAA